MANQKVLPVSEKALARARELFARHVEGTESLDERYLTGDEYLLDDCLRRRGPDRPYRQQEREHGA